MDNKAVSLFTAVPKLHNCAQAVAAGAGRDDLTAPLAACGGGRAPGGLCGALHAALLLVEAENQQALKDEFAATAGALTCKDIKGLTKYPCVECVRLAADLAEKYC